MAERKPRRTVWRTALKALAASLLIAALLVLAALLCATPQVQYSEFGSRVGSRFPHAWSWVALTFGDERTRLSVVQRLGAGAWWRAGSYPGDGEPAALPLLVRAAEDRSPAVRDEAVNQVVGSIGLSFPRDVWPVVRRWSRDGRPERRLRAYEAMRVLARTAAGRAAGHGMSAEASEVLAAGLRETDPHCRAAAASVTADLWDSGLPRDPALARALEACLRGPSPGVPSEVPKLLTPRAREAQSFEALQRSLAEGHGARPRRMRTLVALWALGTPWARRLLEDELAAHPLTDPPAPPARVTAPSG